MDIVTTSNFHATLLPGPVSVVFIPSDHLRRCSWPLLSLLLYGGCGFGDDGCRSTEAGHICRAVETEIFSVVSDRDGVTLFMDPNGIEMFKFGEMEGLITVAPHAWRAIQIHLGPMVAEFPGVVSFLSKLLAESNISILNMSTYDTDIIYVQEPDVDSAIACLKVKLSRGVHGLKEAQEARLSRSDLETQHRVEPAVSPTSKIPAVINSGQHLIVYPESLVLLRLRKEAMRESAYGLTKLVLASATGTARGELRRFLAKKASFWSYTETSEEISLFVDQRYLDDFAEESVIVSPDTWRAIKLGGRTYRFDETGVVAAMSGFDTDSQVLNVSSFGSNVTFVLEHTVDESVRRLCDTLNIRDVRR